MSSGKITRFQNNLRVDGDLDLSSSTGKLTLSSLSSAPSSPAVGMSYYDTTLRKIRMYQDSGWASVDGSAAGSLDAAYNGGATIAVDAGAITLTDSQTTTGGGLLITKSGVVTGANDASVVHINSTGAHDTSGTLKMFEISVGTETAGTPIGMEVEMNANGDSALTVTKGAVTLSDGALTLTSGALSVTGAVTLVGNTAITGTFSASGASTLAAINNSGTITSQGIVIIDADSATAFVVREDGAAADVLNIDTTQDAGDTSMLLTTKVTTGSGLHVNGATITTGDALKVTVAAAIMTSAGAAISVVADGTEVFAVRDDGSIYSKSTAEGTTAFQVATGDVVVSDGDFTVSGGESSFTDGVTTTGVGFAIVSSATTAGVSVGEAGAFVLTANSLTTGTGLVVRADAITTGDMLYLDAGGATMTATSGFFINCNDDNASKFTVSSDGRVVIAGTADTSAIAITAGNIVMSDGSLTLTESANQLALKYDASNHFLVDIDSDGSTTLTTTGTNADFDLVTGTTGDITLTAAGDIILAATGADVTSNAQLTITATAADQLVLAYDGSNTFGTDVDADGSTTLTTTGTDADFEIATGTGGDITLDATADIILEAGGSDINADSPLNITVAAGSQLELIGSGAIKSVFSTVDTTGDTTITVSGGSTNILELVATKIVLDSAADIDIEAAGSDINMDAALNITITGTPQLELIESGSIKTTFQVAATSGACTLTTAGGNANHLEIATGTAGDIVLDSAGDITLEAGGADITADAQLTITTAANESAFVIVNNTITTTGPLVDISSTSITTASMLKLNANTAENDGTVLEIVSAGDATSIPTGISVTIASPTTGAATGIAVTMAGATTTAKGIAVTMAAVTTGDMLYIDQGASDTLTAGSGFYINCNRNNTSDFTVSKYGATTIAGTAEGTAALTLTKGDAVISDGDLTVSSGEVSFTSNSTTAGLTVVNNTFTTGDAFVDVSSTSITTGALMRLGANCVTHSGEVLEVISLTPAAGTATGISVTMASVTTGAATGIAVTMVGATTTAKGIAVTMDGLTTGDMLYLDNGDDGLTGDGKFINCNEDNVSKFSVAADGNTTIAGTAAATAALTLSLGDLVLTDTDATTITSVNGTGSVVEIISGGAMGADKACLEIDAAGEFNADGSLLRLSAEGVTATNAPYALDIDCAALNMGAIRIVTSPTTRSAILATTAGILAADSAVMELVSSASACNADSSVLRLEQTAADGVAHVVTVKQDDIDMNFINFEGATAADYTSPVSTEQGDGTVEGPKKFSASAGWLWIGMVRCAVNGVKAYVPYYEEDPS